MLLLLIAFLQTPAESLTVTGLRAPVEIIRDRAGIPHIYAGNEHDLFFAQGYNAARDRLFQLEIWRRQATGTMSELVGRRELARDVGARLFRYRGDMERELRHYHERGPAIVQAFVDGINAYISVTERDPKLLPLEFRVLRTRPMRWTPEVVISRHQALVGNVEDELNYGRAVAAIGPAAVKRIANFHPGDPDLTLDTAINRKMLGGSVPILDFYRAFHSPVRFAPGDVIASARNDEASYQQLVEAGDLDAASRARARRTIGSNNWVVSGRWSASGAPLLANDPHRNQSIPSLRYWVHLTAPGWNVIGGGEPAIPGISIGHNDRGAWGLTIFESDAEDLYVYRTNPANARQYWYRGNWETMRSIRDTIPVKGERPVIVDLHFTRHGPVVYQDSVNHVAYAVRTAWLEAGGAPYLASLRMDQAATWDEFRAACSYSNIPGENMVWADRAGNIGWQAVGIAPIRKNWSGLVPVPGDGRYEWNGYLPILDKPHVANPSAGFIATANNDLIPQGYAHMDAMAFEWSEPFRYRRITEVLGSEKKLDVADVTRLQTDYLSIPARELVPMLAKLSSKDASTERARRTLLAWDFVLDARSVPAGIYEAWYRRVYANLSRMFVPPAAQPYILYLSMQRIIDWLRQPGAEFGSNPTAGRDALLLNSLTQAVGDLTASFGANPATWSWGQPGYHHFSISHPLSAAVDAATRARLNVGPAARGGDSFTVGETDSNDLQSTGASFRIALDLADWEKARGTNNPGQSGDPASPHYRDLFALWSRDQYFTVPYARPNVERLAETRQLLRPPR
jgi:penicillin amidase